MMSTAWLSRRGVVLAGALAIAGCLGEGDDEADPLNQVGTIEIVVDGEPVNLSKDRYQAEYADDYAMEFHLHERDDYWYNEGTSRITLAEGLAKLPEFEFATGADGDRLVIDDATYDEADGDVEISYEVNEEPVDPGEYELADNDEIVITVETA